MTHSAMCRWRSISIPNIATGCGPRMCASRMSRAAVVISAETNVYTQIGFENAVAAATPVFARFRESGKTQGANGVYEVKTFNHGLILKAPGEMGETGTRWDVTPLKAMPAPL